MKYAMKILSHGFLQCIIILTIKTYSESMLWYEKVIIIYAMITSVTQTTSLRHAIGAPVTPTLS